MHDSKIYMLTTVLTAPAMDAHPIHTHVSIAYNSAFPVPLSSNFYYVSVKWFSLEFQAIKLHNDTCFTVSCSWISSQIDWLRRWLDIAFCITKGREKENQSRKGSFEWTRMQRICMNNDRMMWQRYQFYAAKNFISNRDREMMNPFNDRTH